MPTGYPSLTKNQKLEIDAMMGFISHAYETTVLLVVLTQRRDGIYWSCLRNDGAIKIKSIENFYYPKLFQFSF